MDSLIDRTHDADASFADRTAHGAGSATEARAAHFQSASSTGGARSRQDL